MMPRAQKTVICLVMVMALSWAAALAAEDKQPQVMIRFDRIGVTPNTANQRALIFEVTNRAKTPIFFAGYLPESYSPRIPDGHSVPLYQVEFQREGKWKPQLIGWCGTGSGAIELKPGAKVTFDIPSDKEDWEAMKVGIMFTSSAKESRVVWCEVTAKEIGAGKK